MRTIICSVCNKSFKRKKPGQMLCSLDCCKKRIGNIYKTKNAKF